MALISLRNIELAFGGAPILAGVDFNINAGERVCLIGRNGEGKSTLFKLINRTLQADSGEMVIDGGIKIAMLEQDVPVTTGSVFDVVLSGAGNIAGVLTAYHEASDACSLGDMTACETMSKLQLELDNHHGWDLERKVNTLLSTMGLNADDDIASLSGGRKRRVLLARALLTEPDVLLLDEPTNHLDVASIEWLENFLLGWQGLTLLFVSHDRAFVDKLATRIVELDRGILRSYDGNYARYQELKEQELIAEEKQNANFDKKLAQEEVWIRQGIKARRTRNEGRVRALKALREEHKARREQVGQVNISMNDGEQSGKLVCNVKNLHLGYIDATGQENLLVDGFYTRIMRGDKIGIIGDNGVGKSTLIHAILGMDKTDINKTGSVKLGTNLEIAFLDQLRDQLDLEASVAQNVSEGSDYVEVGGNKKHIIGYLQDFLFAPERARTPVKALSGGERNRVLLAKQLLKPANVLVLDEPTNDLDMATLELLEEAVSNFNGTVLLISHDRAFMDNVVTSTWVFDGKGKVNEFVGGYQDYLVQQQRLDKTQAANQKTEATNTPNSKSAQETTRLTVALPVHNGKTNPTSKRKLSYKEQRELNNLPDEIAVLETEQNELQEKLADGSWFTTDLAAATQASERLHDIETLLLEKLERWTQLEAI